jgi:hypothetical protein
MQYIYFVCGFKNSTLFNIVLSGKLESLNTCSEILIESKKYFDLSECEQDFAETMQKICLSEEKFSNDGSKYALLGKSNDTPFEVKSSLNDLIDPSILYTFFVADTDSLKSSLVKYNVFGCLKSTQ